jgi:hypothetical protein
VFSSRPRVSGPRYAGLVMHLAKVWHSWQAGAILGARTPGPPEWREMTDVMARQ